MPLASKIKNNKNRFCARSRKTLQLLFKTLVEANTGNGPVSTDGIISSASAVSRFFFFYNHWIIALILKPY